MDPPVPASLDLLRQRALHRLGPIAQHVRTETGREIDVDVAIDIAEPAPLRPRLRETCVDPV